MWKWNYEQQIFGNEFVGDEWDGGVANPEFTDEQLKTFRDYASEFLRAPYAEDGYQVDLSSKRNDFDKPEGRVFIMTPQNIFSNLRPTYPLKFPQQINSLKEEIEDITGIKNANMHVTTYDAIFTFFRRKKKHPEGDAAGRSLYLFVSVARNSVLP